MVLWNWKWTDDPDIEQVDPDNEEEDEIGTGDATLSSSDISSNEEAEDDIPAITHSVVFKCIGCIKKCGYQELLARARQKIKKVKRFL